MNLSLPLATGACASQPKPVEEAAPVVDTTPVVEEEVKTVDTTPVVTSSIAPGSLEDFRVNVGERVYFDLASQSVVDPEVEAIMADVRARFRSILRERIRELTDRRRASDVEAAAVYLIAGVEGLALERLDRGETPELAGARRMWVRSVPAAMGA